jgi:hypothetical protein
MIAGKRFGLTAIALIVFVGGCGSMCRKVDQEAEKAKVERVIKSSITWAMNKDKDLLFRCFANDTSLFFFSPDNAGTVKGFAAFKTNVEQVFMNPAFKAIRSDFKDLRIDLSRSGDVAWWSCFLDDMNEWNGQPANWENVRWTGVLEKRDGHWVIVQMHFSHSLKDMQAAFKKAADSTKS